MIPAQFHVDILTEVGQIIPNFRLLVPSFVVVELKKILERSRGKDRIAASVALKIVESPQIEVFDINLKRNEHVDDALLRISRVLCTNDVGLKRRARDRGITVIFLRQKKYLDVDGYLGL
ncbi:MAG: type II toxin-antitoxin system VapC family toxin [Methanobacterium sp.]